MKWGVGEIQTNINDYNFSEKLNRIINDTIQLLPKANLTINIVDEIQNSTAMATHDADIKTLDSIIEIKKDYLRDDIISHEVLHSYFFRYGFPRYGIAPIADEGAYLQFGKAICNSLIHRLINEKQQQYGIDIILLQQELCNNILMLNEEDLNDGETNLYHSLIFIDAEIFCNDYYKNQLSQRNTPNFVKCYNFAKRIYKAALEKDYRTPFDYRRAAIKSFKELDIIASELHISPFNLCNLMWIEFIPSIRQLDLNLDQVFDIKFNALIDKNTGDKISVFISKADKQPCYMINIPDDHPFKINTHLYKLKDFYQCTGFGYTLRN